MGHNSYIEDFIQTTEEFPVNNTKVEFEIRARANTNKGYVGPTAFWAPDAGNRVGATGVINGPGLIGAQACYRWENSGTSGLVLYLGGNNQDYPDAVFSGLNQREFARHVITVKDGKVFYDSPDCGVLTGNLAQAFEPGGKRHFSFGARLYDDGVPQVIEIRNLKITSMENVSDTTENLEPYQNNNIQNINNGNIEQPNTNNFISVVVNGKKLTFDVQPVIENDRTLVPVRVIFEALDARVDWDEVTQTVTAVKPGTEIKLVIGGGAYKNGTPVVLDVPAKLINNRTMVPLRFISESFGGQVLWDDQTQTAIVISPVNNSSNVDEYFQKSYIFLQSLISGDFSKALEMTTDDFKNNTGITELTEFRGFITINGEGQIVSKARVDKGGGIVETIGVLKFTNGRAIAVHLIFKNGKIDNLVGR
ncbi:copper amine oxidase N-terminal domain-containing protein [Pelotomaculum isophthalicicum JI]|uniref:Copper amine oxidase N-terminal domain-containing protein n=1 Tax=Pelotomaculum isophthalicicum JI TaxID=947010 RepID=A0A9X4JV14_9FIRM|nr:copper amine oxidase N-terminal domain-containing protein [Pelotomaculum isophthalicicum]MDF9407406.1 copper amine oxidase N-terminal domain-containing protein [Pelotomaculum isophthalicicum JI]